MTSTTVVVVNKEVASLVSAASLALGYVVAKEGSNNLIAQSLAKALKPLVLDSKYIDEIMEARTVALLPNHGVPK